MRKATINAAIASITTEPTTVTERRSARRKTVAAPKPEPVKVRPEIDLTRKDARDAIKAAFPTAIQGKVIEATEAENKAALAYLNARDAAKIAEGHKTAAGNVLCYAIGDAEEIQGDGWKATWKPQKNQVDWDALVKELNIPGATVDKFRKPDHRVLLVSETVEE